MKPLILYSSKTGNTEKVAKALASELNCELFRISKNSNSNPSLNEYDFFFIGTGITYSSPNEDILGFLNNSNLPAAAKCAIFITWGGAGKTNQVVLNRLEAFLRSKGQTIIQPPFFCYGGWNLLRRGHPKDAELKAAKEWAKSVTK